MLIIIVIHMPVNIRPAPAQLWPRIRIHTIDIVQPPGIGTPSRTARHISTVSVAAATNRSAPMPANAQPLLTHKPGRPSSIPVAAQPSVEIDSEYVLTMQREPIQERLLASCGADVLPLCASAR